jgi:asparagine synthase (glutamine-hydrolysing)
LSGIVGIWNLDGRPVERAVLTRLSETLAHRGPDGEGLWAQGEVGLACRLFRITPEASTETQPLIHSSGTVLVFDGRLDNREELLASLKSSPELSADSPDPALVLAVYDAFGDRFLEWLTGDFALGLFDPRRQQLLLARDAIGMRPLYYYRNRGLFVFASESKAILAHPQISTRPNDDIVADYLLNGAQNSHGMTCFEDVFSLLPAHMAILTPQGFTTSRYWDFDPAQQMRLGSFQEYAEAFRDHFVQAVRRRLRSAYPVAVSVSGGLDSSSIFCLAETLRRREPDRHPTLLGLSYISPDGTPSDEKAFLLEIERDYGITIERVPIGPTGLVNGSREEVWHTEIPFLDEQWNTTHTFLRTAHQRGARVFLTGHWADEVLFPQAYLIDLFRRLAWREIGEHLKEYSRWYIDMDARLFRQQLLRDLVKYHVPDALLSLLRRLQPNGRVLPWYTKAMRSRARRRAAQQTVIGSFLPTAHARSLYEEARSNHHVRCMEWDNKVAAMHGLEMAFPFLDRDLLSFLISIPGEMQTWKGIPKVLLREAMRGILPDAIARRNWKANFGHLVNEGVERDYPQLVHCLQSEEMAVKLGYIRGDVMRNELTRVKERVRGPGCEVSWGLSDVLGLELWLQVFCTGNYSGRVEQGTSTRGLQTIANGGTK